MLTFESTRKHLKLEFEDDEVLQLCPRCSTPNKLDTGYCVDCQGLLQKPKDGRYPKASEVIRCGSCGHYNIVGAMACSNKKCRASFTADNSAQPETATPVYIKVCPSCQHENPAAMDECENCGEDISLVIETEKMPKYTLFNLATHQIVLLCHTDRQTIGTEHFLQEQLKTCDFVSRTHVDIFCRDGQWYIRDRSRNGTYLKGKRLEKEVDIAIEPGTVISLGDPSPEQPLAAHFRFDCYAN